MQPVTQTCRYWQRRTFWEQKQHPKMFQNWLGLTTSCAEPAAGSKVEVPPRTVASALPPVEIEASGSPDRAAGMDAFFSVACPDPGDVPGGLVAETLARGPQDRDRLIHHRISESAGRRRRVTASTHSVVTLPISADSRCLRAGRPLHKPPSRQPARRRSCSPSSRGHPPQPRIVRRPGSRRRWASPFEAPWIR